MEVRNRFKGLDLIDGVPDELWTEVRDIVQDTGIKTIPMEKKCKKAKWLSGEDLQIAVKRREAKSKGEKERYKHLNTEFQRGEANPFFQIEASKRRPLGCHLLILGPALLLLGAYIREMKISVQKRFKAALLIIGEGNGDPLQYSCLENPVDGGAW